jgi:hypothetical protein
MTQFLCKPGTVRHVEARYIIGYTVWVVTLDKIYSSCNITATNVPKRGLDELFQTKPKFAKTFRWGKNCLLWPLSCLWMNYRLLVLTWFGNSIIWFTARCKHTPQAGGPPLVGSSTLLIVEMFERICSLGKIANLKWNLAASGYSIPRTYKRRQHSL